MVQKRRFEYVLDWKEIRIICKKKKNEKWKKNLCSNVGKTRGK